MRQFWRGSKASKNRIVSSNVLAGKNQIISPIFFPKLIVLYWIVLQNIEYKNEHASETIWRQPKTLYKSPTPGLPHKQDNKKNNVLRFGIVHICDNNIKKAQNLTNPNIHPDLIKPSEYFPYSHPSLSKSIINQSQYFPVYYMFWGPIQRIYSKYF